MRTSMGTDQDARFGGLAIVTEKRRTTVETLFLDEHSKKGMDGYCTCLV
jgi:hypothetical protein